MHTSLLLAFTFNCLPVYAEGTSFREKIRERIKERIIKNQEKKPAPAAETDLKSIITRPGDYTFSFPLNGITRMYQIHVPAKYDSAISTPMLLALHGGGGDMQYQAEDKYYKQISKSEDAGFIVVFPNGYSKFNSGKFATWNAGNCCGAARDSHIDDVGFIKEVVGHVSSQLNIDKNKIFATGMSNGAMLSYRLACELSDVVNSIAAVAGTDNTVDCIPKRPISILHIHAKDDDHVLFNGGAGVGLENNKSQVTKFTSVPATIAKWVKFNGCENTPKRVLEVDGAYCDLYSGCKNKVEVKLCVTETGGHSWPGGVKPRGNGTPSKAISASDMMWEFFKNK